ncbi:MAG: alkaline phosphatase [Leptolyngbyaceae cyanobacterium CRU_2_3]|nr:alkaline phosphatase [Leptolyngbyaceae cyanobacterium CRU_2_3]
MIGDGMGWEMARAAAIANGAAPYTRGKGEGLSMQKLSGYRFATTYGTTIFDARAGRFSTGNSALDASSAQCRSTANPAGIDCAVTGNAPVRAGFSFKALPFNPGTDAVTGTGGATDPSLGNLVGYDPARGGPNPWTPADPSKSPEPGYITLSYPDSANTASTLYTGVKSFNNAMAVDVFEKASVETILQTADKLGKSTGVVTSVPITHATPGAAVSSVNRRNKYDNDFPSIDNILQEAIRSDQGYLPTVMLGGGHPLDHDNTVNDPTKTGYKAPGTCNYVYIKASTYKELTGKNCADGCTSLPTAASSNPSNRYGYRFLERQPGAGAALLRASERVNPNRGGRLLGLFGARGQAGNIPVSTANGDYSSTGLASFARSSSLYATPYVSGRLPVNDVDRPLQAGETAASFIARERNENPTLAQMTRAALNVLGKDKDGFWLMVEGGDIDWAAHDNNMDNLIGTVRDFDRSVQVVLDWINRNGWWEKNVLIVTADHDHYLTLYPNFRGLLRSKGAEALTYGTDLTVAEAGHSWGPSATAKYGWGSHSNRMVPVYYQGKPLNLERYIGQGYKAYGFDVPGVPNAIDQVHIYKAMLAALKNN